MSKPRIKKVVQGVHMGLSHDGLALLLKKEASIDVHKLEARELVMCLNTLGDKLKVVGHHGDHDTCKRGMCMSVLGYVRVKHGRIMMEALQYIPDTFGGGGFNYDAACRRALEKRFSEYPQRRVSALETAKTAREAGA